MQQIEPITDYLKRKLREVGAARFEAIADAAGVNVSFIRKFFYGSRENPRVQTIQPLIDYFRDLERGEHSIPDTPETNDLQSTLDEAGREGLIERRELIRRAEDRAMRKALKAGKGAA